MAHQYIYIIHDHTDDYGWQYRSQWSALGPPGPKDEPWVNQLTPNSRVRRRIWLTTIVPRSDLVRAKRLLSENLKIDYGNLKMQGELYRYEKGTLNRSWNKRRVLLYHNRIEVMTGGNKKTEFSLQDCEVKMLPDNQIGGGKNVFVVRNISGTVNLLLSAEDSNARRDWVFAIQYQLSLNSPDMNFVPLEYSPPTGDYPDNRVLVAGDLKLEGKEGEIIDRSFQLLPREVVYYDGDELRGRIFVEKATVTAEDRNLNFTLTSASGIALNLAADTAEQKNLWMLGVRKQVQSIDNYNTMKRSLPKEEQEDPNQSIVDRISQFYDGSWSAPPVAGEDEEYIRRIFTAPYENHPDHFEFSEELGIRFDKKAKSEPPATFRAEMQARAPVVPLVKPNLQRLQSMQIRTEDLADVKEISIPHFKSDKHITEVHDVELSVIKELVIPDRKTVTSISSTTLKEEKKLEEVSLKKEAAPSVSAVPTPQLPPSTRSMARLKSTMSMLNMSAAVKLLNGKRILINPRFMLASLKGITHRFVLVLESENRISAPRNVQDDAPLRFTVGGSRASKDPRTVTTNQLIGISNKNPEVQLPAGWFMLHQYINIVQSNTDDYGWQYRSTWSDGSLNATDEQWVDVNDEAKQVRRRLWMTTVVKRDDFVRAKKMVSEELMKASDDFILKEDLYVYNPEKGNSASSWQRRNVILYHNKLEFYSGNEKVGDTSLVDCEVKLLSGQDSAGRAFPFSIFHPNGSVNVMLDAGDKDMRLRWMRAVLYQLAIITPDVNFTPFVFGPPTGELPETRILLCGDLEVLDNATNEWDINQIQLQEQALVVLTRDGHLHGRLLLDHALVKAREDEAEFTVKTSDGLIVHFRASSPDLKFSWVRAVKRQISFTEVVRASKASSSEESFATIRLRAKQFYDTEWIGREGEYGEEDVHMRGLKQELKRNLVTFWSGDRGSEVHHHSAREVAQEHWRLTQQSANAIKGLAGSSASSEITMLDKFSEAQNHGHHQDSATEVGSATEIVRTTRVVKTMTTTNTVNTTVNVVNNQEVSHTSSTTGSIHLAEDVKEAVHKQVDGQEVESSSRHTHRELDRMTGDGQTDDGFSSANTSAYNNSTAHIPGRLTITPGGSSTASISTVPLPGRLTIADSSTHVPQTVESESISALTYAEKIASPRQFEATTPEKPKEIAVDPVVVRSTTSPKEKKESPVKIVSVDSVAETRETPFKLSVPPLAETVVPSTVSTKESPSKVTAPTATIDSSFVASKELSGEQLTTASVEHTPASTATSKEVPGKLVMPTTFESGSSSSLTKDLPGKLTIPVLEFGNAPPVKEARTAAPLNANLLAKFGKSKSISQPSTDSPTGGRSGRFFGDNNSSSESITANVLNVANTTNVTNVHTTNVTNVQTTNNIHETNKVVTNVQANSSAVNAPAHRVQMSTPPPSTRHQIANDSVPEVNHIAIAAASLKPTQKPSPPIAATTSLGSNSGPSKTAASALFPTLDIDEPPAAVDDLDDMLQLRTVEAEYNDDDDDEPHKKPPMSVDREDRGDDFDAAAEAVRQLQESNDAEVKNSAHKTLRSLNQMTRPYMLRLGYLTDENAAFATIPMDHLHDLDQNYVIESGFFPENDNDEHKYAYIPMDRLRRPLTQDEEKEAIITKVTLRHVPTNLLIRRATVKAPEKENEAVLEARRRAASRRFSTDSEAAKAAAALQDLDEQEEEENEMVREAKRREARRLKLEEEAAQKAAAEAEFRRAAEREALRRAAEEEAAQRAKEAEVAARIAAMEAEVARKKALDEAAKKAADEEALRKLAEEKARKILEDEKLRLASLGTDVVQQEKVKSEATEVVSPPRESNRAQEALARARARRAEAGNASEENSVTGGSVRESSTEQLLVDQSNTASVPENNGLPPTSNYTANARPPMVRRASNAGAAMESGGSLDFEEEISLGPKRLRHLQPDDMSVGSKGGDRQDDMASINSQRQTVKLKNMSTEYLQRKGYLEPGNDFALIPLQDLRRSDQKLVTEGGFLNDEGTHAIIPLKPGDANNAGNNESNSGKIVEKVNLKPVDSTRPTLQREDSSVLKTVQLRPVDRNTGRTSTEDSMTSPLQQVKQKLRRVSQTGEMDPSNNGGGIEVTLNSPSQDDVDNNSIMASPFRGVKLRSVSKRGGDDDDASVMSNSQYSHQPQEGEERDDDDNSHAPISSIHELRSRNTRSNSIMGRIQKFEKTTSKTTTSETTRGISKSTSIAAKRNSDAGTMSSPAANKPPAGRPVALKPPTTPSSSQPKPLGSPTGSMGSSGSSAAAAPPSPSAAGSSTPTTQNSPRPVGAPSNNPLQRKSSFTGKTPPPGGLQRKPSFKF